MKGSLPARFLLGTFISVSALLLVAVFLEVNRDRSVLLRQFDATARRNASLILHFIEQPMAHGDDAGIAAEFSEIAAAFPSLHFSIASFNGIITYSTLPAEIRARVEDAHSSNVGQSYLDALDGRFSGPGGAAAGQSGGLTENGVFTRLIKKDGRNQVMLLAPIDNRPECYHCHGWTQPVLGALAMFTDVEAELSAFSRQSLALGGYALLLAMFVTGALYFYMRRRFFRRLDCLASLASRISGWEDAQAPAPASAVGEPVPAADPLDHASRNLEKAFHVMVHLDFLESVLESFPLAVAVCDVQGRAAFLSRAFMDLFDEGCSAREAFLGRPLAELVYGRPHAQSVFAQMLRSKSRSLLLEESLPRSGGKSLQLRLKAALVYAGSSVPGAPLSRVRPEIIGQPEIMGILCIFQEVSEEKRIREDLQARELGLRELYHNAGLALAKLRAAATALAGRMEQARAATAGQQERIRSEAQAAHRLAAALNKLAEYWQEFMKKVRLERQAAKSGNEDLRALGEAVQQLGRAVLRFREEAEGLEECVRAFIQKTQSAQEVADQINLLALDTALEAAAADITPLARRSPRKGENSAANLATAAVLSSLVDRLRTLADVSGQAADHLKHGLGGLSECGKSSLKAAEASSDHVDGVIRLLLDGDENSCERLKKLDALLARSAYLEKELQERLADGENLNREVTKSGALALQAVQAVQGAGAATEELLSVIGRLEELFLAGNGGGSLVGRGEGK